MLLPYRYAQRNELCSVPNCQHVVTAISGHLELCAWTIGTCGMFLLYSVNPSGRFLNILAKPPEPIRHIRATHWFVCKHINGSRLSKIMSPKVRVSQTSALWHTLHVAPSVGLPSALTPRPFSEARRVSTVMGPRVLVPSLLCLYHDILHI